MEERGDGGTVQCDEGVSRRPRRVTRPSKKAIESQQQNEVVENVERDLQAMVLMILQNQKHAEESHQGEREAWKLERETWKHERESLLKVVENLRQFVKDQQQALDKVTQRLESLPQNTSATRSWAGVASQPSTRMIPSSGLTTQRSVSPNSSASQQRPKQMASVIMDVSKVTGIMDKADEVKARINQVLS